MRRWAPPLSRVRSFIAHGVGSYTLLPESL